MNESELRWILLALGLVLLAIIYWRGRRASQTVPNEDAVYRAAAETKARTVELREPTLTLPSADSDAVLVDAAIEQVAAVEQVSAKALVSETVRTVAADVNERESKPPERKSGERIRIEPTLTEPAADSAPVAAITVDSQHHRQSAFVESTPAQTAPTRVRLPLEQRKVLALRLAATPERFSGAELRAALESENLQHGKYGIFHRYTDDDHLVFSVASMVEPGTFDLATMDELRFPGLTLFAQLPGPLPPEETLDAMLTCMTHLRQKLGGVVQDERGTPLNSAITARLRADVRQFEIMLAQIAKGTSAETAGSRD